MSEPRDVNTDAPREPLSDERIKEIIEADAVEYERVEDEQRAQRLAGRICFCCDKPLPADHAGDECAECAATEL